MIIRNFSDTPSVMQTFVAEMRDVTLQKDRMRFRRNVERVGELLSYELSKTLEYASKEVTTPLGTKMCPIPKDQLVICSVLRAGFPLHQGVLNYFDHAENAFVSAYRNHTDKEDGFEIKVEYLANPHLDDRVLLLVDPMLATGRSFVSVYNILRALGDPKQVHLMAVIGSLEGLRYLEEHLPPETHLWVASVDPALNDKSYIVPGLGDAGDLSFGEKIQH